MLSSAYATALTGQPAAVISAARDSVGAAIQAAASLGTNGQPLASAARAAFTSGMHTALWIAVAILAAGALAALVFLPSPVTHPAQDLAQPGPVGYKGSPVSPPRQRSPSR